MIHLQPIAAEQPRMCRALAVLARLFAGGKQPEQVMHPAMREPQRRREPQPQQLGPKQLAWLEERFKFYGIHRKQAEAPTGVAVIQPGELQARN